MVATLIVIAMVQKLRAQLRMSQPGVEGADSSPRGRTMTCAARRPLGPRRRSEAERQDSNFAPARMRFVFQEIPKFFALVK